MIRILVLMGGMVFTGVLLISMTAIVTRPKKIKKPKIDIKAIQKENVHLIQLVKSIDKAASAEYAVNEQNIFAGFVSNTIERAKVRSLT